MKPIFLILLLPLTLIGCRSESVHQFAKTSSPWSHLNLRSPRRMTTSGDNFEPRFSPDGKEIIFARLQDSPRVHSQIYLLTSASKRARRLTFQNGDAMNPQISTSGGHFLYASTTDEIKEGRNLIKKTLAQLKKTGSVLAEDLHPNHTIRKKELIYFSAEPQWTNSELYLTTMAGDKTRRLTRHYGYDGDPVYVPGHNQVLFSSRRKSISPVAQIYSLGPKGGSVHALTSGPDSAIEPTLSNDGKHMAWVELAPPDKAQKSKPSSTLRFSQIFLGDLLVKTGSPQSDLIKSAKALVLPKAIYNSPQFTPDGHYLIFTASSDGKNEVIKVYDLKKKCFTQSKFGPKAQAGSQQDPSVSPDGHYLAYASNVTGNFEIYLVQFQPKPCHSE